VRLSALQESMFPTLWGAFDIPATAGEPWSALRTGDADALAALLASHPESMVAIRAARMLRAAGRTVAPAATYGALVVVPVDEWLDVLAAYADGAVRYYNGAPSGGATIVDGSAARMPSSDAFVAAAEVALRGQAAQELPVPESAAFDIAGPVAALFASDGERVGVVGDLPAGGQLMAVALQLLQEVTRT
jgi:hypothetical protein